MAIVSKTIRSGIDEVINTLQERSFPKLLPFWLTTDYISYPRANKNPKEPGDIIAEISLDEKDYKEVLMDDEVSVTSFWLVADDRPLVDATKLIKHNISIIFQCDLVKLYGDAERSDEKFNQEVLSIFKAEQQFIVGDIEISTGVDNVYEDLTLTSETAEKVKLHDMSNLHVVRLSFNVLYNPDCFPKAFPVCSPCTQTLNSVPISPQISGTSKVIIIENDLAIPVQTGIITLDTPTALTVKVPAASAPISTLPFSTGQEVIFRTGDDGDRFNNGDYASVNIADIVDYYTLKLVNEFGHFKRLTGDTGGFMDEATGSFFDKDGVATTKALAFPNNNLRDYAYRRKWHLNRSGSRIWNDGIDLAQTDIVGGEGGWFLPNKVEYETLSSNNANSPTYYDSRLFNWSSLNMWSSTTHKIDTLRAHRITAANDSSSPQLKTQVVPCAYIKLF